jgi:polyferredoxin
VVAVGYLGVARSYLVSVVNIFALLGGTLPILKYNLGWYAFAGFTVGSTLLWGRLYCGRVCAFGALTQLLDRIVPARLQLRIPSRLERHASRVKYVLLAAVVAYFIVTRDVDVHRYVEPFWVFGLSGTAGMWVGLSGLLVATIFVRNLYCRFLCPVGAALGLLSTISIHRIARWPECQTCRICEKACEWGAIEGARILPTECVRCDDCERLYDNRQKCPHWLILARRPAR